MTNTYLLKVLQQCDQSPCNMGAIKNMSQVWGLESSLETVKFHSMKLTMMFKLIDLQKYARQLYNPGT